MGVVCSDCSAYQEELSTHIIIYKDKFSPVSADPNIFQQIQALTDNQISEKFINYNYQFYRKAPDTFFIGSLENTLEKTFGILYKPQETLLYGDFQNRVIHGKGSLKLIRHNLTFKGEFSEGRPNGNGQLEDNQKTFKFNGIWKENIKPFSGILKLYSNKIIEQIQFINFQHGDAQIYYRNGSVFKGFIDKKTLVPHGSGKMTYQSGDYYEGEWTNGKFEGMGTYIWKTGEKYNGQYFEGLRNGNGDFYYTSGKYYKGAWINGKKEGFGKILAPDGKLIQKGIFRNDVFDHIESENFDRKQMERLPSVRVKSELVEDYGKDEVPLEKKESTA